LAWAVQKNALLRKQLGLPKFFDKQPNSFGNYSLPRSTHINTQWQPWRLTSLWESHFRIILDPHLQKNGQA
jgi:hypothetical protein